jgi:hypothetical protein
MADRNPLVISIDDLQWGDMDSVAFIAELVLPANVAALLLILSFRSEGAESSAPLRTLKSFEQRAKSAESWLNLELGGLSEQEGLELLELLHAEAPPVSEAQSREILRESGGSPMLLNELVRFAAREQETGDTGKPSPGLLLSDMIRHRASTLSAPARELVEALSFAGEPLSKATLLRTVRLTDEDPARAVSLLINDHLLRVTGGAQGGKLEPFHDQVREASLSWLSPEDLRNWHAHLAEIFETEEEPDPQRLLRHYRGAGNLPASYASALGAAQNAETALAFDQAARFYAEALETGQAGRAVEASLHRKRAEALAKAGRGYEAAQSYLEAGRSPMQADKEEMRRLAAEQLIRSGHLDEGIRLFTDLLRHAGIHVPNKRIESLFRMLAIRAFIRFRGLRWRERTEAEIPAHSLRKLDLLWSGAMTLASVDTVFGSYLQALHMLAALRAGEPSRLAISFAFGAFYESMGGTHEYEHGRKLIGVAEQLARRLNDPYISAMIVGCWTGIELIAGRVKDGLAHSRVSESYVDHAHRHGKAWEQGTFNMMLVWFLGWGGRIRELSEKLPLILEEARSRGDVYADAAVRCCATSHLVELAADDPERALAETARTLQQWRKKFYDLPHFYAALSRVECRLYAGRTQEARQLLLSEWPALRKSLFARKSQVHKTMLYYVRGRTSLAEWLRDLSARELRAETEKYAARLAKQRSPWGDALSNLLRAGVMAGLKRPADAVRLLARAEEILREQDLRLLAAAALRRRGELEGAAGTQLIEAADAFMRSENILRPDRMTAMILPGAWLLH